MMESPTEGINPCGLDLERLGTREVVFRLLAQQERALEAALAAAEATARAVDLVVEALRTGGRLIFVGAGTSGRLGVLEAAECPPTFGTPPEQILGVMAGGIEAVHRAREGVEDDQAAGALAMEDLEVGRGADGSDRGRDLVVGLSASGTTPFVLGAVAHAQRRGARTVGVTADPSSPLHALAEVPVLLATGAAAIAGSTRLKAGTATKLFLNTLTSAAMVRLGKVHRGRMVDLQLTSRKLHRRAERIVAELVSCDLERARTLLDAADGEVKTAVVMGVRQIWADEARKLLAGCGRRLVDALAART